MTDPQRVEAALSTAEAIIVATISLLSASGVGAVTTESVCAAAGVTRLQFEDNYPSVRAVFADIVGRVMALQGARMAIGFRRTRSLSEFITRIKLGFLDVVDEHPDEHRAFMCLQVAELSNPRLIRHRGPEYSIHHKLLTNCQLWLREVELIHGIRWQPALHDLAAVEVAGVNGLLLDYLARHDRRSAETIIGHFANNLAAAALYR